MASSYARKLPSVIGAILLAAILFTAYTAQPSDASGIPANKTAASGSSTEVLEPNGQTLLLSETVKINNPTDLILGVTAECAIVTQVTNGANGTTERAFGQVKIYVTIDGIAVPVAEGDTDNGRVVFCNRAQEQQWTDTATGPNAGDDSEDQLRQYISSRSANGFNWMALNVGSEYPGTDAGSNVHEIQVWAEWTTTNTTAAATFATAAVGNRTLILEPVKAANYEAVTDL